MDERKRAIEVFNARDKLEHFSASIGLLLEYGDDDQVIETTRWLDCLPGSDDLLGRELAEKIADIADAWIEKHRP